MCLGENVLTWHQERVPEMIQKIVRVKFSNPDDRYRGNIVFLARELPANAELGYDGLVSEM